jgi:4-hydroxy-tetrahydrodipicolinate reductase
MYQEYNSKFLFKFFSLKFLFFLPMKIALIGYGKMGKTIESIIAKNPLHEIVLTISEDNLHECTIENLLKADVAIEFTQPGAAFANINLCMDAGIPVVVGTTAWLGQLPMVQQRCAEEGASCLVASNFSIGVNLFFELNKRLAILMKDYSAYQVSMEEIHHTEKKDAPSGTAVTLANDILPILDKSSWVLGEGNIDQLPISAKREKDVPGTHTVTYTSSEDTIEITHQAHNREGFAKGAILAAEWIIGKKGYFEMKDIFGFEK